MGRWKLPVGAGIPKPQDFADYKILTRPWQGRFSYLDRVSRATRGDVLKSPFGLGDDPAKALRRL